MKISNPAKAQKMLDECQARARTRMIDLGDIVEQAAKVKADLENLMPAKAANGWPGVDSFMIGVSLFASSFPGSYRGRPEGTCFWIEIKGNACRVVDVCRTWVDDRERYHVYIIDRDPVDAQPNAAQALARAAHRYLNRR